MEKKVTIEITQEGWETTVHLNDKTYTEKWEKTEHGARCTTPELLEEVQLTSELRSSLDSFYHSDVMYALRGHD